MWNRIKRKIKGVKTLYFFVFFLWRFCVYGLRKNIIILKLCQNFWNCHTIWIAWKFGHLHTTFILWQNTQHEYYIHTCFFLWLFIHCVTFYTFYSFCCFITIVSKKPQYNYICVLSTKTTQKAFLCIYTHVVE